MDLLSQILEGILKYVSELYDRCVTLNTFPDHLCFNYKIYKFRMVFRIPIQEVKCTRNLIQYGILEDR